MARCSRIGLYGDFWVRGMRWYARHTPAAMEPFMVASLTFITWVLAPAQRRAIQRNLAVLLPGSWWIVNVWRSLRVFWNFACSLVDATHALEGHNQLDWEVEGMEDFQALEATPGGIIVLTAHMGNYDIAAPVFAEKFGKKLHAVRLPEKQEQMQEFMESTRGQLQTNGFQIHYNRPGNMLAVELAQAIHRNEAVAIQGDRVLGEVAAVATAFDADHAIRVPKGPFILSLATRAVMFPLFIIRVGWRRYRVVVRPPLPTPKDPRNREASLDELAGAWVQTLASLARQHWYQWFVLEDAFVKQQSTSASVPIPDPTTNPASAARAVIRMPSPKVECPRWETALGSMLTTVGYSAGLWWLLHRVLGLNCAVSLSLLWPLLMLLTLALTPFNFVVQSVLKRLGIFRKISPQRFQGLFHYALSAGILYYCLRV
jgi:lauroyl/myristoyl acyltransferase